MSVVSPEFRSRVRAGIEAPVARVFMALHLTRIFDLNPVSNYQCLSSERRIAIKNEIKRAYELGGLHARIWDEFTILISPFYESELEFYHKLLKAYPSAVAGMRRTESERTAFAARVLMLMPLLA